MRLIQLEEIEQLLLQVPRIFELQKHQPAAFVARAAMWMDLLEQALTAARAHQAARIAALRSQLGFARSSVAPHEPPSQTTRARRLASSAASAVSEATAIASAVVDEHRPRFADANRRMRALVADARSREFLSARPVASAATLLAEAHGVISGNGDLEREYHAIEASVGADDASLLLSRAVAASSSARISNGGQHSPNHAGDRRQAAEGGNHHSDRP